MTSQGYIKLFRSIEEWEWIDDPMMFYFWVRLLIMANWEDREWHGEVIRRGMLVTTLTGLSKRMHISIQQVRTFLSRLKNNKQITIKSTNKATYITICRYDDYQGCVTNEQQTNNTQINKPTTQTKEDKEERIEEKKTSKDVKEKKTRFVKPTVEQVSTYCHEQNYDIDAEQFIDYYESKGWVVGNSPMKDWKAAIRTWVSRRKRESSDKPSQSRQAEKKYSDVKISSGGFNF